MENEKENRDEFNKPDGRNSQRPKENNAGRRCRGTQRTSGVPAGDRQQCKEEREENRTSARRRNGHNREIQVRRDVKSLPSKPSPSEDSDVIGDKSTAQREGYEEEPRCNVGYDDRQALRWTYGNGSRAGDNANFRRSEVCSVLMFPSRQGGTDRRLHARTLQRSGSGGESHQERESRERCGFLGGFGEGDKDNYLKEKAEWALESLIEKLGYIRSKQKDYSACLMYLHMYPEDALNRNRKK